MSRLITLSKKATAGQLNGSTEKQTLIIQALRKLGARKRPIPFEKLVKAVNRRIRSAARVRSHVRGLASEKLVTVSREKQVA